MKVGVTVSLQLGDKEIRDIADFSIGVPILQLGREVQVRGDCKGPVMAIASNLGRYY